MTVEMRAEESTLPPIDVAGAYSLHLPSKRYRLGSLYEHGEWISREFESVGNGRVELVESRDTGAVLSRVVLSRTEAGDVVIHETSRPARNLLTRFEPPMLFAPASIRASSGALSTQATVTVTPVPVATVSVSPASPTLAVGATQQLSATARDADGNALTGRTITWQSAGSSVATVSASGLVTAQGQGNVTITATVEGASGSASVTVSPPPVATVTVTPS